MGLAIKYRPQSFDALLGNQQVSDTLQEMIANGKLPQALLITGDSGCGKTTIGRIIANALGCSEQDFNEIDSADFRGIDTIRHLRQQMLYRPISGKVRVWLIDECHKMTNDAQNAFLKALEEPPGHVYFILCTTDPLKLLATIKSRCTKFTMIAPKADVLVRSLFKVTRKEGRKDIPKTVIEDIVDFNACKPRACFSTLEKFLAAPEGTNFKVFLKEHDKESEPVIELCRCLLKGEGWPSLRAHLKKIKEESIDPGTVSMTIRSYMASVLLNKRADRAADVLVEFEEQFMDFPAIVSACYELSRD